MRAPRRSSGFTLIEIAIVIALGAVLVVKASFILREASTAAKRGSSAMVLEDQARSVLDRIAYAIMGADRRALVPENTVFPLYTPNLRYEVSVGLDDGEVVWSDPELITLENGSRVVWLANPEEEGERRVVWSNLVRSLLEGETINGVDDNDNGLIDEEGLSFVIDGNRVTIRLSLARMGENGEIATYTVNTTVTCRNGAVL